MKEKFQIGDVVSFTNPSMSVHLGKITEMFPSWRPKSYGGENLLHHVHYYKDGKLMQCPDFDRCQHKHTCPIHGANVWAEQIKRLSEKDIAFLRNEGILPETEEGS